MFACTLIKKHCYWPAYVAGNAIEAHLTNKNVGEHNSIQGTQDGQIYFIWAMKEPDYVIKLMATGGKNEKSALNKLTTWEWKVNGKKVTTTLNYPYPAKWHYKYRQAIDDHNNLRHAVPSIKDSWTTHRWELRVLAFVITVCKVYAFLCINYSNVANGTLGGAPTLLKF